MTIFDEGRSQFSGFNSYYRDEILPDLIAKDMERRRLVERFKKMGVCIVVIALIGVAIGLYIYKHFAPVFVGGLFAALAMALAYSKLRQMKRETKSVLVGKVCQFIGWSFKEKGFVPIPLDNFITYGLLKKPERQSYEDEMRGVVGGANFIMQEAHLEREQRSGKDRRWVTVFRGVLIMMDFPRKFSGKTILLRDVGMFNWKKKKGLKRVGLVDPKFEKIFEAYGSDQVEARYLLHPAFMQRLVDLEALLSGKKLRAAFIDGKLLIAIQTPNQFEAGSMFKPLTDEARTQTLLDEIGTVIDIVEAAQKG